MPRFSANLSTLFTEIPLRDRIAAAADAGFEAFEIQFPYETPIEHLANAMEKSKIGITIFNLPVGDFIDGGPGIAAVPGREGHFRAGVAEAKIYVEALRPQNVNVLAGCISTPTDYDLHFQTLAENLAYAANSFAPLGAGVLCEAINSIDRPGYLIDSTTAALNVIDAASHMNLGLLCDIYHMHMMQEGCLEQLETVIDRIGHIQFADVPGRHAPGTGMMDFKKIFRRLDELNYQGWVGAEYNPQTTTNSSLEWLKSYISN